MTSANYKMIVIGASYGGIDLLLDMLPKISSIIEIPILVVIHIKHRKSRPLVDLLNQNCKTNVSEALDRGTIKNKNIYFAPGDYHLLIEDEHTVSLSKDMPELYARPSINALFESAADIFDKKLIAVILSGSSSDGADGIRIVHQHGGLTIAQRPDTAKSDIMPNAAIDTKCVDFILSPDEIISKLKHEAVNHVENIAKDQP